MDESKPSIPPGKFRLRSAFEWTSVDIDPPPAELDELASPERQDRCGQIEPSRNDCSDGSAVAVYYRNEQEVSRGFLIALSAIGVASDEQSPEPPKPSGATHAHELNDSVLTAAALSVEKSGSAKES
jgi:hypothetical protein